MDVKMVYEDQFEPKYATRGSSGMDVFACIDNTLELYPGDSVLVSTGVKAEVPDGFEIQVRPRSGLALKYSITVLNSPGTIDSDFRGVIGVIMINHGREKFVVNRGDKIAQLVLSRYEAAKIVKVDVLSETQRGSGGFGHTGR